MDSRCLCHTPDRRETGKTPDDSVPVLLYGHLHRGAPEIPQEFNGFQGKRLPSGYSHRINVVLTLALCRFSLILVMVVSSAGFLPYRLPIGTTGKGAVMVLPLNSKTVQRPAFSVKKRKGYVNMFEYSVTQLSGECLPVIAKFNKVADIFISFQQWFDAYFTWIRPLAQQRRDQETDDKGCFFLGQTGAPIANPKVDLERLWQQ